MRLSKPTWLVLFFLLGLVALVLFFVIPRAQGPTHPDGYLIESIQMPEGLSGEVGGLGFFQDSRLAACFHRGEVMIYNPQTKQWKLFAEGLHDPLGLLIVSDSELLVM